MASFCLFALFLIAFAEATHIPDFMKLCSRDDPDLNECIKDSISYALENLAEGYDKGGVKIPPLDPYVEKETKIEYKRNQIYGKVALQNVKAFGMLKTTIHEVRADIQDDSFYLEVDMSNPEIFVEGFFRAEGRLNALALASKGSYNNTMYNVTWTWKLTGEPVEKDGKVYMKIVRFSTRPEIGDMEIHLPVLFENAPALNRIATEFATKYWRVVYRELLPTIEEIYNEVGTKHCNKVFLKIPYDEMFPISS